MKIENVLNSVGVLRVLTLPTGPDLGPNCLQRLSIGPIKQFFSIHVQLRLFPYPSV